MHLITLLLQHFGVVKKSLQAAQTEKLKGVTKEMQQKKVLNSWCWVPDKFTIAKGPKNLPLPKGPKIRTHKKNNFNYRTTTMPVKRQKRT